MDWITKTTDATGQTTWINLAHAVCVRDDPDPGSPSTKLWLANGMDFVFTGERRDSFLEIWSRFASAAGDPAEVIVVEDRR